MNYFVGVADALPGGFDFRVPSDIINILSEEAWNYFSDAFPQEMGFAEFIQGLTQLRDLLPRMQKTIGKTVAGGYLNYKFGWEQLLRDLDDLSKMWDKTISRMDYLRRTYGVPTRLGFHRKIDWHPPSLNSAPGLGNIYPQSWNLNGVTGVRVSLTEFSCEFRATAWIMQHLDYVSDLIGFLRVLAGELGFANPIKSVWNLIPFSFIVDWFTKTSTHLDNITRFRPAMGWDVDDVTQSVTYDFTFNIEQYSIYDPRGANTVVAAYAVPVKVYERFVGLSFQWALLNPEELSPTQLTLLLAMFHQYH